MRILRFIVSLLLVIGALNWGLIAFFHYDPIADLFGMSNTARMIYGIIGIAGLFGIGGLFCACRSCHCAPNCSCATSKNKKKH